MIRVNQIKLPIKYTEEDLHKKIQKLIKSKDFTIEKIIKKSIDARNKSELMYILCVDVKSKDEEGILKRCGNNKSIMLSNDKKYQFPFQNNKECTSPIIVGAGPAGYFCALYLARNGYKPILFERGLSVDNRSKSVSDFWEGKPINSESNVSFGEGGAGTFSDGKLNTGIKDKYGRIKAVIDDFISFGAPKDISYINKPHIGTDELKTVLKGIREEIEKYGGQINFNSKLVDYKQDNENTIAIIEHNKVLSEYKTNALILAIGHSARDTFFMLHKSGVNMEPKSFAIGLRIEHKRSLIDKSQYGESDAAKFLPAADYKMTYRAANGRSVYSFCMCPGGFVVNASSGENQSVVNGMSNHARNEENSNSAIVVNVTTEDFINEGFAKYGVLAGVEFQKKYEKLAYDEGNGNIPIQLFKDYKEGHITKKLGHIKPNIKGKYQFGNLNNCLPTYVNNAIIEGICYYDGKLKGFSDDEAVLSGIESRTSSPVRIIRDDETLMSINKKGIFPCGEGAGYAGGITSAAVDGIKVAEMVAKYINNRG